MPTTADVVESRRALGRVGVCLGVSDTAPPADEQCDAARRLEGAGYRAVWTNEVVGADALVRASLWLAATERLVVGTCIANMWVRPPQTAHAAATQLAQAYPGRFVLGLGVGRPEQAASVGRDFGTPLATAGDYLRSVGEPGCPRILGAIGPRMLALARDLTDGALPAGIPPSATEQVRATLGADKLLVVYVPIGELDEPATVSSTIDQHLAAGADHVIVGMSYATDFGVAVTRLDHLAPAITDLGR